jgi:hypothetical protein
MKLVEGERLGIFHERDAQNSEPSAGWQSGREAAGRKAREVDMSRHLVFTRLHRPGSAKEEFLWTTEGVRLIRMGMRTHPG